MKWDEFFIKMALHVATKSKDPSRQVGCVIVGPDNEVRTTGFNGFPRGVTETVVTTLSMRRHHPVDTEWYIQQRDMRIKCSCGDIVVMPQEKLEGIAIEYGGANQQENIFAIAMLHDHFKNQPTDPSDPSLHPARWSRPQKYDWVEHAERNAIYNAARMGIPLKGCLAYITLAPCAGCTRALIQAGIDEVYGPAFPEGVEYLDYGFDKSIIMLGEAGVKYTVIAVPATG